MAKVTQDLIYEILKKVQPDISDLKQMRHEMRDGFASLRQRNLSVDGDILSIERRITANEEDIERIKRRLEILDE